MQRENTLDTNNFLTLILRRKKREMHLKWETVIEGETNTANYLFYCFGAAFQPSANHLIASH